MDALIEKQFTILIYSMSSYYIYKKASQ